MRALLITPDGIQEVDYDGELETMYSLLDCRLVDGAGYPDNHHAAWVDDEGLLQELHPNIQVNFTSWHPTALFGKILVTGYDPTTGDSVEATMTTEFLSLNTFTTTLGDSRVQFTITDSSPASEE